MSNPISDVPCVLINNGKSRLNLGPFQTFVMNGLIKFWVLKAPNSITDEAVAKPLTSRNLLCNKPSKLMVYVVISEKYLLE